MGAGLRRKDATFHQARPSREVAVPALVHEFRTRSKVLVCTGNAKDSTFNSARQSSITTCGTRSALNSIGRCHRYSQQRDVTVVNFIARDNEAHRLTFEILSQKLDLFWQGPRRVGPRVHEPRTDAPEIVVSAVSLSSRRIY
jgi:hypothetical protein